MVDRAGTWHICLHRALYTDLATHKSKPESEFRRPPPFHFSTRLDWAFAWSSQEGTRYFAHRCGFSFALRVARAVSMNIGTLSACDVALSACLGNHHRRNSLQNFSNLCACRSRINNDCLEHLACWFLTFAVVYPSCARRRRVMRLTFVMWLVTLLLGVLLYMNLYTSLLHKDQCTL